MSGIYGFTICNEMVDDTSKYIESLRVWNDAYGQEGSSLMEDDLFSCGISLEHFTKCPMPKANILKYENDLAVIDCIIYNREDICDRLSNSQNMSDEELLLWYVETYGYERLADINGDFAGAIFNKETKSLTLFRDHMGVRPLFYYAVSNFVAFSTDIRGLIALPCVDCGVNEDWLYKEIGGFPVTGLDNTEFEYIKCVMPASIYKFSFCAGKIQIENQKYWSLGAKKKRLSRFTDYKSELRELITDAISRRVNVCATGIGAELSGGLDSGVIDILINRLGAKCKFFSWSLDTLELPLAENDERLIIKDICEQEKIECKYIDRFSVIGKGTRMEKYLKQTGIDMPEKEHAKYRSVFPDYINTLSIYSTSEYLHGQGVRMVFSGHGGDEGVSHRMNPYEMWYNHEFVSYFRYAYSILKGKKFRILRTFKYIYNRAILGGKELRKPFEMHSAAGEIFLDSFSNHFHNIKMAPNSFMYDPIEYINSGGSRSRLDVVALLGGYGGVHYVMPYLDYRVIDFAVSIPRHLYIHNSENRYIFRETFKDIMPKSLYELTIKSTNSRSNYHLINNGLDDKWFEIMKENLKFLDCKLDRGMWGKYINFDMVAELVNLEKSEAKEKRGSIENYIDALTVCYSHQNLVKKLRANLDE